MVKTTKNKVLSWISFILSALIFVFALTVFIVVFTARGRNGRAEIFGYSFAVVVTNSMAPEIVAGDLIIIKSCEITDIEEGQNAVFIGLSGEFEGKSIVHRVLKIYDITDDSGEKTGICLETKGINNPENDEDYVYAENFIGREIYHSTFLGRVVTFLQKPLNWIFLLIILIALYFAGRQGVKIIKIIKNKEKDKIEDIDETDKTEE